MENKKNYIDGVDVSGCNNIDEWKHCNICQVLIKTIPNRHQCLTEGDLRCEFYPDCYYKQLQRAETEIEELKKQVKNNETAYHTELGTYNMECGNLLEENKTLIAENEKLKIDIGIYKGIIDSDKEENEQLKVENERLKGSLKISQGLCKTLEKAKSNEHEQWFNRCCEINTERDKYCQALQEIREELEEATTCESRECGCDDYGECINCLKETILDKINEVIGEN